MTKLAIGGLFKRCTRKVRNGDAGPTGTARQSLMKRVVDMVIDLSQAELQLLELRRSLMKRDDYSLRAGADQEILTLLLSGLPSLYGSANGSGGQSNPMMVMPMMTEWDKLACLEVRQCKAANNIGIPAARCVVICLGGSSRLRNEASESFRDVLNHAMWVDVGTAVATLKSTSPRHQSSPQSGQRAAL